MAKEHEVRIGTSGWNDPTPGYGPWTGVLYRLKPGAEDPRHQRAKRWPTASRAPVNVTSIRPGAIVTPAGKPARRRLSVSTGP